MTLNSVITYLELPSTFVASLVDMRSNLLQTIFSNFLYLLSLRLCSICSLVGLSDCIQSFAFRSLRSFLCNFGWSLSFCNSSGCFSCILDFGCLSFSISLHLIGVSFVCSTCVVSGLLVFLFFFFLGFLVLFSLFATFLLLLILFLLLLAVFCLFFVF